MSTMVTGPRWAAKLVKFAFVAGIVALVLLALAGPGYRLGVVPLVPALLGAALAFALFIVTFIVGGIGLLGQRGRASSDSRPAKAIIAIALVFTVLAGVWIARAGGIPAIHDITTDLDDPPMFKDIVPVRAAAQAANAPEYQRVESVRGKELDVPGAQRSAYPDIQPLVLPQPPERAAQLAHEAARDMGWDIVAFAPAEGRIEGTDTTFYFGFKDDVVIRVRPDAAGSRIDVRSESRVGLGDAGTNVKRVRAYLAKLRERSGK
jgi:hypothetical protein